jgi:UDP-N-acetylmuramate dehydrogenase
VKFEQNVLLKPYTSWQVGGFADWFCQPQNHSEVEAALMFAIARALPWSVLGGGSNLLVSDQGVEGVVIHLGLLKSVNVMTRDEHLIIDCHAGTAKSEILKIFLKYKLAPALFLAGIPGDVGGGIVMNAGVSESFKPKEFGEIVDSFSVIKVEHNQLIHKNYTHDDIHWTYRHTQGWQPGLITNVRLKWPLRIASNLVAGEANKDILQAVRAANQNRLAKQPLDKPSCGSVFVNPEGHKAAQLIDQCGLKGYSVGDAMVSTKHANFIVNNGNATAKEIQQVMQHVQNVVLERFSILLKSEVVWLGRV